MKTVEEKYENYCFAANFRNSLQTDPNECQVPISFDEFEQQLIQYQIDCYQEGMGDITQ